MSKKERLEKEKQKQLNMVRLAELDELEAKEEARHKESRAAKKYRKKAKKGYANIAMVLLSLLMIPVFLYSGVAYGGFTIIGSYEDIAEFIPKRIAGFMAVGDILMLVGIILCFCRKYKAQAVFNLSGSGLFLYAGHWIVRDIQKRMEKVYVDPSIADMDKDYMKYYYPVAVITVLSLILLITAIVMTVRKARRQKHERDTAPVESIID